MNILNIQGFFQRHIFASKLRNYVFSGKRVTTQNEINYFIRYKKNHNFINLLLTIFQLMGINSYYVLSVSIK